MAVTAARSSRPLAQLLIATVVLVACSPVAVVTPSPAPGAVVGAAPTARSTGAEAPAPGPIGSSSGDDPVNGDAVTGGVFGPDVAVEPLASPTEPSASPLPATSATASRQPVAAARDPFAMNLYRKGDFVAQYTFEWCVGASLQMALNMTTDERHTSRADQQELWEAARDRSFSPFGGANPRGWTTVLNELEIGPYELVSSPTLDEALMLAAEAIRATKRPVGLVMWRGRHAWVMSGFKSTADPLESDRFDVTGIRVLDPLYPHGSSVWGPSPRPNSLVSPATLAKQFVVRDVTRSRVNLGVPTGYLLIVPVVSAS